MLMINDAIEAIKSKTKIQREDTSPKEIFFFYKRKPSNLYHFGR